jgi:hypothetical protein
MAKLALVLFVMAAAMVAGLPTWKAEATPLTGTVDSLAVIKGYSTVQKAGCMFGTSRCPAGSKWVCTTPAAAVGTAKSCVCRTC